MPEQQKLRPKYHVQRCGPNGELVGGRMDSTDPNNPDSPFVLMPRKDPAAFMAMLAYAMYCEPELAAEIRDWLRLIAEQPTSCGTQGERNGRYMRLTLVGGLV